MLKKATPWAFMSPFLLLFLIFLISPLFYAFYISMFVRRMGVLHYVGLHNYTIALQDSQFWHSILRVVYYGILSGIIMLVMSLSLALLLDTRYVKFKSFFRLAYFLPYAVPGVIAAVLWGFLYSPNLDPLLKVLHLQPLNSNAILYSIINLATWEWAGYNMTLYVAGLTGVTKDLYDAARIDGCNEWQLAYYIKIPLLRPTINMTVILSMIGSIQLFNEPFLLGNLTAIPSNFTPNMDIYTMAFNMTNAPYAATLSVILGVLTIVTALVIVFITNNVKKTSTAKS